MGAIRKIHRNIAGQISANRRRFGVSETPASIAAEFAARVDADGGSSEALACLEGRIADLQTKGFWNKASALWLPHGYKSGKIYAVKGGSAMDLAFSRVGTRTRANPSTIIETLAANIPALDYAGTVCPTLSCDPSSTNLLLRSQEFDSASWTKTDTVVTANATTAPDNTATADLLTSGTAGTAMLRQGVAISANATVSISISLKKATVGDWVLIEGRNSSNIFRGWFNIGTGAVGSVANAGTATGATASIEDYGSGWYRCILTGAVNNSVTSMNFDLYSVNANSSSVNLNNATKYAWGAQLEQLGHVTSYIPTAGSTVSRTADSIAALSNVSSFIGQTEGTLFFDGYIAANGISRRILTISDGTIANRAILSSLSTTRVNFVIAVSSVNVVNFVSAPLSSGWYKMCATYSSGIARLFLNGVKVDEAVPASLPPSMSMISVTGRGDGGTLEQYNGEGNCWGVSKTARSEAEAIALTTP